LEPLTARAFSVNRLDEEEGEMRKEHCYIIPLLLLTFIASGEMAYATSLQQRTERLNRYAAWVNDANTIFIPLRLSYVRGLSGDPKTKEKEIKKRFGGWYKRREQINGKTVTVYYVPYDKTRYQNYFYNRRWKHLQKKDQKIKWEKRMAVSREIKEKLRRWIAKEKKAIKAIKNRPTTTFNGTWYLSGGANDWKMVLKQNGNKVWGNIYTKDVYGSEARVGKVDAAVSSVRELKGTWYWDYDPNRHIGGLGENHSKDRLELAVQHTKSRKIIKGVRIDPPHRVNLQGSNEGDWY
jgi:hypothetical protein